MIITTNVKNLRDPFVLVEDDAYYLYGSGVDGTDWINSVWACFRNTDDSLSGNWERTKELVYVRPENAQMKLWAPEVHKYKGHYYMFATYHSSLTNHKGCTVLKSDSPEGPFVEISDGHVTPHDINAIDATFYVDEDGQPWIIYVHEWTCTDDSVGRMAAARLSDDLTHMVSEPVELFRADSPSWTNRNVTDGCFMYRTSDGRLLMLWSNFCGNDYCVAVAESKNGRVDGEWLQHDELLFSKELSGNYDGGHGMIFKDRDGQMYLSLHSPNTPSDKTTERTIFVTLREADGRLVCDI